jgi:hypothetical protein
MSKQTAVDLLVSILNKDGFAPVLTNEEIQQAKQMEKEQILDAVKYGCSDWGSAKDAEQYYNETYGGQDETL